MSVIGHMASFPARATTLEAIVRPIAPQVDRLVLVLNEFLEVPDWVASYPNVSAVIPDRDLKDVGKFLSEVTPGDDVFLFDDDITYPADYVARTLGLAQGRQALFTYHGAILTRPLPWYDPRGLKRNALRWRQGEDDPHRFREKFLFRKTQDSERRVNLAGSGVSYLPAALMPTFAYMNGSAGFVDLRLARWCAEQGIEILSLPHDEGWVCEAGSPESLFETVTSQKPAPFRAEMRALMAALFD